MRLLSLDYDPVYGDDATRSSFSSDISVFDYDVAIWDPRGSFGTYFSFHPEYYRGLPAPSENISIQMKADVARRQAEFFDFLNAGRILVTIVRPPQRCYLDTGERSYSGTGRSRVTTKRVSAFDLLSALPAEDCKFTRASGNRIDFDGDGPLVRLLRKYRKNTSYEAVVVNPPGQPLAHVAGTDRIVSSVARTQSGGYLLLLPVIDLMDETENEQDTDGDDDDIWLPEAPQFQEDLLAAIEHLGGSKTISRPAWTERFATVEQQRVRSEVVKQQKRVESARAKLMRLQQQKEETEAKDQLFLGTGRALEVEVRRVLELLGGKVTEPVPGRDDWKVSFPEGDAVVEVKGVTKSAAEKHAAQLEKWVSGAYEETAKMPKGILVVNTWRETPLDERTKEDFPEQMLPYSEGRGHCLVTGLQLFVIRADIERDPTRAEHWRKKLLEIGGRMTGCDDWQAVVQETKTED